MALNLSTVFYLPSWPVLNIKRESTCTWTWTSQHFWQTLSWRPPCSVSLSVFMQSPLQAQEANLFWTQTKKIHFINDLPLWTNEHYEIHHTLTSNDQRLRKLGLNITNFPFFLIPDILCSLLLLHKCSPYFILF